MKNRTLTLALLASLSGVTWAQTPSGKDISSAIPYYFGQVATGLTDPTSQPYAVYSLALAKGQTISVAASRTTGTGNFNILLLTSAALSVNSYPSSSVVYNDGYNRSAQSFNYVVPATGTYYIVIATVTSSMGFQLTAKSTGTPIAIPNPATAGCLTGTIDYITYSLQMIAADLPDEASIGGTRICSSCAVKAPGYMELARKMDAALASNSNISACYDSTGSIFQLKVGHP